LLSRLFGVVRALRLLVRVGLAGDVSLWRRRNGRLACVLSLDDDEPTRRERAAARAVLASGAALAPSRRSQIHALPVLRFGRVDAALVARVVPETRDVAGSFLAEAAASLSPLLERALLLDRSAQRERELVTGSERRLTRLGFDLHDGPIQDVLALAADVRRFRDEMHPFVVEPHQEQAIADLEELQGRLVQLDRDLRELAHSLESKSAVSRPIEEVLHREIEAFAGRTGIEARIDVTGNTFLSASQRIALFRAVQEALSNVREHSAASRVEVSLRCRRSWTELRVEDDGQGFRVDQGLASAARRGRLGLIGISERVRMLGGTFQIDSAPGGPTALHVTLPRWEPLDPAADQG
jgi:signal transduction histidine kinase